MPKGAVADPKAFPPNMDGYTKGTKSQYAAMGFGYCLEGVSTKKIVESAFGPRPAYPSSPNHYGLDFSTSGILGKKVVAVANGKVTYIWQNEDGKGYAVEYETDKIDPKTGEKLRVICMHLRDNPRLTFDLNDRVEKGITEIGRVGNTGSSAGPHLHFEVFNTGAIYSGDNRTFYNRINPVYFYPGFGLEDNGNVSCPDGLSWDVADKYKY